MRLTKHIIREITDEEKKKLFHNNVAMVQRGKPEQQMLKVQKVVGGGVMQFAVEHIGDLTHRMAEKVTFRTAGFEYVKEKVDKCYKLITSGYGFEKEFKENLKANSDYHNIPYEKFYSDVKRELKRYAEEHSKIKVYNRMQWLARQSAVELGNLNFDKVESYLKELKSHTDQGVNHWVDVAHES